ncbi:MAG: helix-turn-helix domain-containing protein [Paracoccaceae bacterium]
MLTATYAHLHNFVAQIEQLKARTGPQRVAEFLLELTQSPVGSCSVELPYDKVLIAGRLGMKPESLSRAFTKLREQGVRIQQNSAEIDDVEGLRDYAERDRAMSWHQD